MKSHTVKIDGTDFIISKPLGALTAVKLDKQIIQVILPMLGGIKNFSLDSEVSLDMFGGAFAALSEGLSRMSESQLENFLITLFQGIQVSKPGISPFQMDEAGAFDKAFDTPLTIYKLAFEVMKFNSFSPFALAGSVGSVQGLITGLNGLNSANVPIS